MRYIMYILGLIYVMNNVLIMCKIMVPYCGFYIPWIHRNCVIIYYCHDFIFACSHNMNSFLLFKFQVSYFYEVMVWTFSSIFKDEIQEFRPFLSYENFHGMLVAVTYQLLMVSWLYIGSDPVYFEWYCWSLQTKYIWFHTIGIRS